MHYIEIALSVCPSVRRSVSKTYFDNFLIFLHQTLRIYCVWQHGHNNHDKVFRSKSHLLELCPFLFFDFVNVFAFLTKYPRATLQLNTHLVLFLNRLTSSGDVHFFTALARSTACFTVTC